MRATVGAIALLALSCVRMLPWRNEPVGSEVNLAFRLQDNLIELQSVRIDNREGRFILGTAAQRTVVDSTFALRPGGGAALQLAQRETIRIQPLAHDLRGVADAIVGAEAWRNHAITIDYRSGLVTYQKEGIRSGYMTVFRYHAEPMIYVGIDGRETAVIVDTASPDTLILPGPAGRGTVDVAIAGTLFGPTDVRYANVAQPRIGNRLLSRFLVTIDYGKRMVGVWRDPRNL